MKKRKNQNKEKKNGKALEIKELETGIDLKIRPVKKEIFMK